MSPQQLERFVVFEGLDGSGQDTQAKLYAEYLKKQGFKVWLTSEPSKDLASLGVTIRYILTNDPGFPSESLQLLCVADRAMHVEKIKKYIDDGYVVVCVRYIYSTLAFGFAEGLDINWLVSINKNFPRPKAVIYLNVPTSQALGRVEMRSKQTGQPLDRFENLEKLDKTRAAYGDLKQLCPEFISVDATGNPEEVTLRVREALGSVLGVETADQKPLDLFVAPS